MNSIQRISVSIALASWLASPTFAQEVSQSDIENKFNSPVGKPDLLDTGAAIAVISKSRKIVAAYSASRGTWARLEFDEPLEKDVSFSSSGEFIVLQTKANLYAYSSVTSTWDLLKLSTDTKLSWGVANSGFDRQKIRVIDGNVLYVFGLNDGVWSGIDLDTGRAISPAK